MLSSIHLTDHFLIAMPALEDHFFAKSLIYIAEHNEQGAMGVIVNRPIDMTLSTLFQRIDLSCVSESMDKQPVFLAGRCKPIAALSCIARSARGNRRWRSMRRSV